jgi:hypothetical protein
MTAVSYDISKADAKRVRAIVQRAKVISPGLDEAAYILDLAACHANGTRLDLAKLEGFAEYDFAHDVFGIINHLDRATGQLRGHFEPRCAK